MSRESREPDAVDGPQPGQPTIQRTRRLHLLSVACGLALVAIAAMHALKAARGDGDVVRHLVFVLVDGAVGVLVAARPRWALAPVALLTVQQLGSHGRDLLASVRAAGPLDVESLLVLLFFGSLLALLVAVRRAD